MSLSILKVECEENRPSQILMVGSCSNLTTRFRFLVLGLFVGERCQTFTFHSQSSTDEEG